ncbi:DNA methyltransferase [Shewanella sp. KT0246]|uniref:DNA methyltransferase n=1 Tax=Shewanella sp. KT0246 TaxID=2815912 RepID=UPI001BC4276F|nr:DNA methyltransferase [Shewanella sp. KT0246]GIU51813.1 hypothetical protein TUM4249_18410 [Shewanella sp. KT0246]
MTYSWLSLKDAYNSPILKQTLENMESQFHGRDETGYFSSLVNTSISKKQPYHRWMRYREGYAGDLVKELLKRFPVDKSDYVIDPMCGSGSTMVACNELNIASLGLDVNPYAVLSTKVKGYKFTTQEIIDLKKYTENILLVATDMEVTANEYDESISKYFNYSNLNQLIAIKSSIKKLCTERYFDFFFMALLSIIEDCSNRKKDGNGLATRETKIVDCFSTFSNQIEIMLQDFQITPHLQNNLSKAILTSAINLDKPDIKQALNKQKVGSIIFSPPYANSFDYFESYKMELIFGEWSKANEIKEKRKLLIRNFRLSYKEDLISKLPIVELLCDELWKKIPQKEKLTGKRDGRTRLVPNMLRAYFADMGEVINKGMHLLKAGGHMHIVIDQSAYVGVAIPTDTIFAFIANELGYEVIEILKCRKANTSGQQMKQYPYLKDLLRETIVTIKKPDLN